MGRFSGSNRDGQESNYWIPVTNIFAAVLLVVSLMLFIGTAGKQESAADLILQEPGRVPEASAGKEPALKAREEAVLLRENELEKREEAVSKTEVEVSETAAQVAETVAEVKEAAAMRNEIIERLAKELSGLRLPVEIHPVTGNIRFTEAVLFDISKDSLNDEGRKNLEIFVPKYLSVLLDDPYKSFLDQIIIEGHADNGGSYQFNLDLSQKRANSVMAFILSKQLTKMSDGTTAEKYFTVSARSYNVPVLVDGVPDRSQSRRVEFSFRLKDEKMLQKIQNLSSGE